MGLRMKTMMRAMEGHEGNGEMGHDWNGNGDEVGRAERALCRIGSGGNRWDLGLGLPGLRIGRAMEFSGSSLVLE